MIEPTGTGASAPRQAAGATSERERLREAAGQLESVFVQRLFAAMRETVPHEGVVDGGSAEEIFTSMLDERLSSQVPRAWDSDGIRAALLRQLAPAVATASSDAPSERGQ